MRKVFLLGLSLFMSISAVAEPVKLMVLGDSLSVGHHLDSSDSFCSQLERALVKKGYQVQVLNYSKSGETTAGGLAKVKDTLFRNPDAVLLQLGSNDAFQGVPLETTTTNLQSLISFFQKKGLPVLLIGMEAPVGMPQEYRDGFRKMYVDLATENELLLYPFFMNGLWNEDGTQKSNDYFLGDGIHPSSKGVQVMVRHILPAVEQFIAEDVADVVVKK